jgi:hypothetical protein
MTALDFGQMLDAAVVTARMWDEKGDANWAARTYAQAVMVALRAAVKLPDVSTGVAFLRTRDVLTLIGRASELSDGLGRQVQAGQLPASTIGGNYHLAVLAHVAWLMDALPDASRVLAVANQAEVRKLSSEFWVEYAVALQRLDSGASYEPARRDWKRERYWAPYLELVGDLSHGRDAMRSAAVVEAAFQKRNHDRRFAGDQYGVEGSGREPAEWDFRLASLRAWSARRNSSSRLGAERQSPRSG